MRSLSDAIATVRNEIGRFLGVPHTLAYTKPQRWHAKAVWDAWYVVPGCNQLDSAAWCGNADGETSFLSGVRGDKLSAGGLSQWHQQRRDVILRSTGIDVWTADVVDQCKATLWEVTTAPSAYRKVLGHLQAQSTLRGKVEVLVREFEQSGSQDRDIERRTGMAEYWLAQFGRPDLPPNHPALVSAAFSNL